MEGLYEDNDEDIFNMDNDEDDPLAMDRNSRMSMFVNNNCPLPAFEMMEEEIPKENENSKNNGDEDENIMSKENRPQNENNPENKPENEKKNLKSPLIEPLETKTPLNAKSDKKDIDIFPKSKILQNFEIIEKEQIEPNKENEQKGQKEEKKEMKKKGEKNEKEGKETEEQDFIYKERTFIDKYISEDKIHYVVVFEKTSRNEIIISLTNDKKNDSSFTSKYEIDYLNEKFGKVKNFKNIKNFIDLLVDNVKKHLLIIKKPYKNVINTVWKLFPSDSKDKKTFTLISSQSWEKNLSLLFYSNFKRAEKVVKEIENQAQIKPKKTNNKIVFSEQIYDKLIENMIFLDDKFENNKTKIDIFKRTLQQNIDERKDKNIEYRNVLIFFEENNLHDTIMNIIEDFYQEQIFIIIYSSENNKDLDDIRKDVEKFSEYRKSYFNINNIFIYKNESDDHKKILLPILKIFSYFNQLGDGFFKQLSDMNLKIENLDKEFKYLFHTHYFNILLCGRSGSGKSTFINTIMGEKKSFTLKDISAGTYRNNYYIHKKYPIKLIDICGFSAGNEGEENLERLKLIYNEDSNNIIIDEYSNDSFSFYGDKRNNIHLLLYFNVYDDKYDVVQGELPIIMEAIEKKIPIIFIINKCKSEFFEDKSLRRDMMKAVKRAREKTDYGEYDTYFINCISKKGLDELLKGIYDRYEKYLISNENLNKIKDNSIDEKDFEKLFKDSIFFGEINPRDVFLNESLINSVMDIKNLVVKVAGYYSKELKIFSSFKFFLFEKLINNLLKNSQTNFFPLLTSLVKKIYKNFGYKKSNNVCNKFIISKLSNYFNIKLDFIENENEENKDEEGDDEEEEDDDEEEEGTIIFDTPTGDGKEDDNHEEEFDFEQFKNDYINLVKLYWFSKKNFKIEQDNSENILKNNNNFGDKIFNIEDENNIQPERIFQIIKRDFGLDNSKNDANNQEKTIVKLFYISYVCNELISTLCGKINKKGFKYRSIYNFYYTVSKSYNNAINGFTKIIEDLENNGENKPAPLE